MITIQKVDVILTVYIHSFKFVVAYYSAHDAGFSLQEEERERRMDYIPEVSAI